jgi:hypothetical protein
MNNTELKFHKIANIYPLMDGDEFESLCNSVKANGLRHPIITLNNEILDGRNRYRACRAAGVTPTFREYQGSTKILDLFAFVRDENEERRQLTKGQKAAVAVSADELMKELATEAEQRMIAGKANPEQKVAQGRAPQVRDVLADMFGTNRQYVSDAKKIKEQAPRVFEQVLAGNLTLVEAKKEVKASERKEQQNQLVKIADSVPASDRWSVFQANIQTAKVDTLLDAIITDPPYPKEYLPLWDDLGRFAKNHLKPGGVLLAMTPAPYLPQVVEMLGRHLTYQWIMACVLPGSHGSVIQSGVRNVIWKPILVYRNGGSPVNIGSDLFENDKRDKDFHEWGQGVGGYLWQIENFTNPNDLVCDPFLGGGTTAIAALQLKRRFVGFDADAEKVAITKGRLSNVHL